MNVLEQTRKRLIPLLVAAIVLLIARVGAMEFGAPESVQRAFYVLAIGCLVGCLLVILLSKR